jgi:tetratricopeptide (TPR) repeat protein
MTTSAVILPLPLRHSLELGDCVLFLGAGIGHHMTRSDGKRLPDASELARELVSHFSLDTDSEDLSKVAELLEIRKRKDDLEDFIRKSFSDIVPDDAIRWLCSRRWRAIFTTNYDRGIERAYEMVSDPPQVPKSITGTSDLVHCDTRFEVPIYHIHGAIFGANQHLIISQTDYTRFREKRRMLFELLKKEFATATLLYVGYSHRDPNWALLLNEIAEEFLPSKLPQAFRVTPSTSPDDLEILKARGIDTIDADLSQFVAAAASQLEPFHADADRLQALQSTVPSHLLDLFKKNPAPVARLIASWQFVNQAPFSDAPNTHAFFRGDRANWALVGAGLTFRRDIEDEIFEAILDYVTSGASRPTCLNVLGPAGYGTTTILMNVAARLVKERIAPIYFLHASADLIEGDIDFAIGASQSSIPCFIIDNAAENGTALATTLSNLRDAKRPSLFICGERLNEWRQRNIRVPGKEYLIDALSDSEIDRLLDCLERNGELNKLQPLTRDLQRVVIREKHGKELLIAMREATEDKRFDAILEDEFFGIEDDSCRDVYLITCCFHQHGIYLRDMLLYDLSNVPLTDFHDRTKGRLDGVVLDECIDESSGQYGYRTRHRTIAAIVWDSCGEGTRKDDILHSALEHLNLNYRVDAVAFEKFIRNDALIDMLRGLESKIKFFDLACKKEPFSPYVRQHYARMLYRTGRLELALAQIDQGIAINPKATPRVLIHTKGTILGALALQAESVDIGRRRLAQAEEALRRAMSVNPRDEYVYQALASLYLDWAKHSTIDAESANYLAKAEECISDGLRKCRVKDALWIVSSEIERWLGDRPSQLRALETAVKEVPGSVIARYLLAKAYGRERRYPEALGILDPNIRNYPDELIL